MRVAGRSSTLWLTLMATAGFCGFIYELALAQLLTGLLGGAMLRFATTLGVYVVALGVGSVSFKPKNFEADKQSFLFAEIMLFVIGLSSPVVFVLSQRCSVAIFQDRSIQNGFVLISTHLVIWLMGFFCGREMPILVSVVKQDARILSADYIGMFLASLAFPFLLFPTLGLIPTFAVTTLLNLGAAIATQFQISQRSRFISGFLLISFLVNVVALVFSNELQSWLSRAFSSAL